MVNVKEYFAHFKSEEFLVPDPEGKELGINNKTYLLFPLRGISALSIKDFVDFAVKFRLVAYDWAKRKMII